MCKSFVMIYRQTVPVLCAAKDYIGPGGRTPVYVSLIPSGVSRHHPYTFQRHSGDCQSDRGSKTITDDKRRWGSRPYRQ
jgi:hypothetical protein